MVKHLVDIRDCNAVQIAPMHPVADRRRHFFAGTARGATSTRLITLQTALQSGGVDAPPCGEVHGG